MKYINKFACNKDKADEIRDYYNIKIREIGYEYYKEKVNNDLIVSCYKTKNPNVFTVTFESDSKERCNDCYIFTDEASENTIKTKESSEQLSSKNYLDENSQIGSDEVGVGDFFGPTVVVASYVKHEQVKFLKELGINDSKKLSDSKIVDLGEKLIKIIPYVSKVYLNRSVYKFIEQGFSSHAILANAHNYCHKKLMQNLHLSEQTNIYIDQFEPMRIYLNYLHGNVVKANLHFQTKAESLYPSVAVSSIIARYIFLKNWEYMEKDLNMIIPKGAGSDVDKVYQKLIKINKEKTDSYVKKHFRNYKENL